MKDSTHTTLITAMLVVGALIVGILIGRGTVGYRVSPYRTAQTASTAGIFTFQKEQEEPRYRYSNTVTSYSRPHRITTGGTSSTTTYDYETVYSYTCQDGYCWTNQ